MALASSPAHHVHLAKLQPLWHKKTPRQIVEQCLASEPFSGWKIWQKHLQSPKRLRLPRPFRKGESPLLWGWPVSWDRDSIKAAIESPTSLAELAIGDDSSQLPDLPLALQLVALAYTLPQLANELPAETWWSLIEHLHQTATQAAAVHVDWETDPKIVVRAQLLAGELPLVLGYLFPEIRALHALRDEARAAFSDALVEITDGQGLLHARLLPVLPPLFACWTRARLLGGAFQRGAWSRAAEIQYEWLVRHAIRLANIDHSFALSNSSPGDTTEIRFDKAWSEPLFKAAVKLAGDRRDHAAATLALPAGIVAPRKVTRRDLPKPSLNSDWSCVSIMAEGWSKPTARLALAYAVDDPVTIELSVGGEPLLAGHLQFTTTCNGRQVQPDGEWEQLCWESGKAFDFLELGLSLTEGLRLERQILFGRHDHMLYLADIVFHTNHEERAIQHTTSVPLANDARWTPAAETRDGIIAGRDQRAAVMPMGLKEWRADPRGGSLTENSGRLVLSQSIEGRALCCPLFLDFDTERSALERTWRQLTVGEWLEVVPADQAVGYRAQSGDDQWLTYRSLGKPGNRTLLGHNVAGEFCAGQFVDGKFKEWIEIEAV